MSYSTAVKREVYLSWKPVFARGNNAQLRKLSKIRAIVNNYAPLSRRFWHPNLVKILQSLLEDNIFYSEWAAQRAFPDLFDNNRVNQNAQSSQPTSAVDELRRDVVEEFTSSIQGLYSSGEYADLTILCCGKTFNVHKAIVCPRSAFFTRACRSEFKEGRESVISLPEDDLEEITHMIHYFYHLDYKNSEPEIQAPRPLHEAPDEPPQHLPSSHSSTSLMMHARIYALAEKYLIPGLKTLAVRKFKIASAKHWDSDDFLKAAQEAYTSTIETDRGLRDIVLRTFHENQQLMEKSDAQELVRRLGSLASDLVIYASDMRRQ